MRLKMPLKMHRLLSLLAFVLAFTGGILVVVSALGRLERLSIASLAINGLVFLFGLGAILGGWMIYTGIRKLGGITTPPRRNNPVRTDRRRHLSATRPRRRSSRTGCR
jgi:hypothetical protein